MRNAPFRFLTLIILVGIFSTNIVGRAAPIRQDNAPRDNASALLEQLTPEERIGQLFIVTFTGPDASSNTPIYDLIVEHHIGGVMMLAANDNFLAPDVTAAQAQNLIRQLQLNEYNASRQTKTDLESGTTYKDAYIPLFTATIQDGDGYDYDQILNGVTMLPNPMTIGATWDPEQARRVGSVLGSELSAIGFNLLIGPSLDVLDTPNPESDGDMGARAFGGDPFWVGQMGSAYITGLHQGSFGRLAVVAKNFPGFGGSDRPSEEEVPTVRKPLEQLKQIELAPFFAVTGNASSTEATTDALLVSHIRYQGFQDNIRDTTKPVSFDTDALAEITALEPISTWRENDGILISSDLGSRAVRRFYDPSGQTFESSFVARDAFVAGNDLLYLGNFTASNDPDTYTSIVDTLDYFTDKYRQDESFAQRVNESVLRILTLKYRIYDNNFNISHVLMDQGDLANLGNSTQLVLDIAGRSATLISPSQAELADRLPSPPSRGNKIVFITDTRTYRQCNRCPEQFIMAENALESAVLRLYSQGGQVYPGNLTSYTFQDLQNMLDAGTGIAEIENSLINTDWIVFSMLNVTPSVPSSHALRNFLEQRPDLFRQKKLIVFAFTAPYYLDATEIANLTAYYGLYSHGLNNGSQYVDMAARLLFQEMRPTGVLPVSVQGIGYDLNQAVFPDPDQIISLAFDVAEAENTTTEAALEATPLPHTFQIGEPVSVRTGVIVDHNGKPVPDNTIVHFTYTRTGENPTQPIEAQTIQGVAHTTYRVETSGSWEIRAESEDARQSDILYFDVPNPSDATVIPSDTATPTLTPTPTLEPSETLSPPTSTSIPIPMTYPPPVSAGFGDWLMAVLVSIGVAVVGFVFADRLATLRWAVRFSLLALTGGLLAYTYLAIGLPGSQTILQDSGLWGIVIIALLGASLGSTIAWGWKLRINRLSQ